MLASKIQQNINNITLGMLQSEPQQKGNKIPQEKRRQKDEVPSSRGR